MKPSFKTIYKDAEFVNDGYNNYLQYVDVSVVDKGDYDGLLSLCIDSRLAVTQLTALFPSKEPISTAGNVFQKDIRKLDNFSYNNVLITHGIHPDLNKFHHPACGGHTIALKDESPKIYSNIIRNLQPYVKRSFDDYDPFVTTKNLARVWRASDVRFYDHTTGDLYQMNQSKIQLKVSPATQHAGLKPTLGQDPTLIVINTLGRPFFKISSNHRNREIGGVVEIFYPQTKLPQSIIESLVFCLQNHYLSKYASSLDEKALEEGQFQNSDTLLLLAESESKLKSLTKSLLTAKNPLHKKFIEGYFKDPKDIIIGIVPEIDNRFFEITAK